MYKICIFTLVVMSLASGVYAEGLGSYATYSLDTSIVIAGDTSEDVFTSLDGTWAHESSDRWEGLGLGEGSPGGVSTIDGYLRIQDPGDPRDYGYSDEVSNRKLYMAHNIGPDGASSNVLDNGATLFFRMRLATDGLLDQMYPDGGGGPTDVPATGDGYLLHDGGKGNIGIKQQSGGLISFCLTTVEENNVASGLLMNSLNGSSVTTDVLLGDGTTNLIPLDPTVWHDFWVTIQKDTSGIGTHQVDVSVDGGTAQTFLVTAGGGDDYDEYGYICLGAGSTSDSGAFDVAAFQFTPELIVICPPNGATEVAQDVVFSWTSSESADAYDLYLGTDFDDVNNATRTDPLGVLVARELETSTFTPGPDESLELGRTYYWRVDEMSDDTISKGDIWSFTVESYAKPISADNIIATASSFDEGQEPENTINEAGLDDDLHTNDIYTMWATLEGEAAPAWIQYEFDKPYKLYEMLVWNYNGPSFLTAVGLQDVTITYSTDDVEWKLNDSVTVLNAATGEDDYAANTTVPFGEVPVKYVRITATSNWSDNFLQQHGLSEVRFLHIPVEARDPDPADGASNVDIDITLGWRAGRESDTHNLYISADEQAVIDGTAPVVTLDQTEYGPLSLDLAGTYYWRVNEVNNANTTPVWEGNIWSFTTSEYRVVDDFESYNDIASGEEGSNLVYLTWVDGYDNPSTNGSTIGYTSGVSLETTIVRSGHSAPLMYDNTTASISEVTANTDDLQSGSDWTIGGSPDQLGLWIYGSADNDASTDQMYVEIDGVKNIFSGDITAEKWQEFSVDLNSLGIDLSSVSTMTVGFEKTGTTGGTGMVFIDDIRLY